MEEKRTLWTPTQLDFKHNRERRWFFLKIPRCDTNGGVQPISVLLLCGKLVTLHAQVASENVGLY